MSKNRPLVYHWIAHYNNKMSYPQFDQKTYKENSFLNIDKEKLIKFGLYPFNRELAKGVRNNGTEAVSIEFLPVYEIKINKNDRVIHYRDVFLSQESYHICKKCKKEFHFALKPYTVIKRKDEVLGIRREERCPVCPHCGAYDYYKCKVCGRIFECFNDASNGMCPDCGRAKGYLKKVQITSGSFSREKRKIEYCLGKQSTVKGSNVKFILRIMENGDCKIE